MNSRNQVQAGMFIKLFYKFTLIELLFVITIIVILASLLLPSLKTARKKAYIIACMNNVRQIYLGTAAYANDNNGYAPCFMNLYRTISTGLDVGGDRTPSERTQVPVPYACSYGTDTYYYPMGYLIINGYITASANRCSARKDFVNSECFDTRYWLQKVNGANMRISSSYAIKIVTWEDWQAHANDNLPCPYRLGVRPERVCVLEYPGTTGTDLPNPFDIYTHINYYGLSVAYEDGQIKHVRPPKSIPTHSIGSSDKFNEVIRRLSRDGGRYVGN